MVGPDQIGAVELAWGEVAQGLVRAPGVIAKVPGEEGSDQIGEADGPFVDVVELIVVCAEGAFDAAVALRVVGAVEVVGDAELAGGACEVAEELTAAPIRIGGKGKPETTSWRKAACSHLAASVSSFHPSRWCPICI